MKCASLRIFLLSVAIPLSLSSAEPSAFGAGNLSSDNPYGLTSDEKILLETKKKLRKVDLSTKTHASQLDSLRERIDGLQDIVETLGRRAHNNKVMLQKMQDAQKNSSESEGEYQKRLSDIVQADSQKIQLLQKNLLEVSKLVDDIHENYVSKEEFNNLVEEVNNFKKLVSQELKGHSSRGTKKVSSATLYNEAKKNFDRKYYTKALKQYTELIQRKYKPAYSYYMIGEIYYKRRDYGKAITYYKKSSQLYSKARYMPNLMLHTAYAMKYTGDKKHSRAFAQALIQKYPSSKEAKEAKKLLH